MNTKIIEIGLCDDYLPVMEQLELFLKDYFEQHSLNYCIHKFITPSDVFDYMKHSDIHILFMDLQFGSEEQDGFLWTKKILAFSPRTLVLILTAYEHRYKEGYRARAFRFMTKPLIRQEFEENLEDCINELNCLQMIQIKHKNISVSLAVNDILYVEAYIGGSKIHTKAQIHYSEKSLLQWEEHFQTAPFFRIHKSYLINFAHVTDILPNKHEILLDKSVRLPVARRKWTEFQSGFMRYDVTKNN